MSQPPPDYSQVIKEREEFQRDVTAANIPVEPPLASNRFIPQTVPLNQSPYPADKSGRQKAPQSAAYVPAASPSMGYGSTQNPYISQQPQPIGQPMHYYQNPSGRAFSSSFPPGAACPSSRDGRHKFKSYHGVLGVVMGILFCPIGCIWTAMDYQTRCTRCGEVMDTGCYSC